MARHYELVNASLVALVAIVGMVFYFNSGGGALGAFHESRGSWDSGAQQKFYDLGINQVASDCLSDLNSANSGAEWRRCCADQCTDACNSLGFDPNLKSYFLKPNVFEGCGKACVAGCDVGIRTAKTIGFNYRGERTSPR